MMHSYPNDLNAALVLDVAQLALARWTNGKVWCMDLVELRS